MTIGENTGLSGTYIHGGYGHLFIEYNHLMGNVNAFYVGTDANGYLSWKRAQLL